MAQQTDPGDSSVAFARSSIGGKKTEWVKGRVSPDLKMDFARRCHELDVGESEYIERLLAVSLYGFDHVVNVDRDRTKMVVGLWPDGGPR